MNNIKKPLLLLCPAIIYGLFVVAAIIWIIFSTSWAAYAPFGIIIITFLVLSWTPILIPCILSARFYIIALKRNKEENTLRFRKVFTLSNIIGITLYSAIWLTIAIILMSIYLTIFIFYFLITPIIVFAIYITVILLFKKDIDLTKNIQ